MVNLACMRTIRIPSSLKWLITRRARLDGEITKLELSESTRAANASIEIECLGQRMHKAIALDKEQQEIARQTLDALKADLIATDRLLRQHEIGIDPKIIKPVRSQGNLAFTDYGNITRLIYRFLREANGMARTATQTTAFIAYHLGCSEEEVSNSDLRYRIRKRMQHMAWEGKITRVANQQGSIEGRWCLNKSKQINFEQEIHPLDDDLASSLSTSEIGQY